MLQLLKVTLGYTKKKITLRSVYNRFDFMEGIINYIVIDIFGYVLVHTLNVRIES